MSAPDFSGEFRPCARICTCHPVPCGRGGRCRDSHLIARGAVADDEQNNILGGSVDEPVGIAGPGGEAGITVTRPYLPFSKPPHVNIHPIEGALGRRGGAGQRLSATNCGDPNAPEK